MDRDIIKRFRDKVNEHDLVLQMYRNYKGKNCWNIICSAMDWIDVVVEAIDTKNLSNKNDNNSSIKVMTFITCIGVMWEAVQQLHRVFFDTNAIPFAKNAEIFQHKLFDASDNDYFQTIRACFAAHQINLNDYFTGGKQKERRYASWSGGGFGNGDFSVILYSNQPDEDALFLDIYFDELIRFAEQRYRYLNTIAEEIERQVNQYLDSWKNKKIERTDSIVHQIEILIEEARQRFNNDYYNFELEQLKLLFSIPISSEKNLRVVDRYKEALKCEVEELLTVLQEMRLVTLESTKNIDTSAPTRCQYAFSKLSDAVFSDGPQQLVNINAFKADLGDIIDFADIDSAEELYVILKAGFFELYGK